ncbi:hypothetical protein E4T80_08470 [Muribacter muris]|uniref:Uncharacterized protein n=1 Tax=Muribacter muris TaxID=67855 RepID=A0A4Y9JVA3_9PAST|nr:hypothetical protein [Muribacter muris]MBF0785494.1 hypothetical protein [Muribacter muris]MBF0826576.1 hypothetical protein [Muribacter muris]TFV09222.1 hypothetical protein E4T80_08470 [Muribacter muris]
MLGYQYHRKAELDNYNQKVMDSAKLAFSGSAAEKTAFAAEVFEKMQQNPRDLRWKRLYGTIQIDFFKNYPQAIAIMEDIYQQTHDNHMLIGICILKEKIKSPFQECYENVLRNVE